MKVYELLTVFKPNLDPEEVDKHVDKLNDLIVEFGGKLNSADKIGRKKLAYEINKFRDGFFVNLTLSIPAGKIAEFRRQLKLNDNILRSMLLEATKKVCV
ncbi:MAG: 30S ribosomal protein S6 [Heliobacteriaceae bacterium]|jgi:small subunit ribosomal protein S6|nr:30S ribosomal protein S6 [Heliobacteriaceae bacterium]